MSLAQQQTVHAVNGFAYGCIGADIHVFGDGAPLYVLQRWRPEARPSPSWLLDLPSRMLNGRFAVVDFTGRENELADLRRWRDHGPRLAVQWLHAPGGQGKSRLAAQFAKESEAAGWTVATAVRGLGVTHPPPGSQDLRTDTRAGVLLVVDYADRWPAAHLTWLLSNTLLHRATDQTRVLLVARSRDSWPAVRASLADLQADASTRALPPLANTGRRIDDSERLGMFLAARDAFAALYGVPACAIEPPDELSGRDFGLTLAVHMAALVAVDRHAHAATAATAADMTDLTAYLLDRERRHWHTLHETGALGTTTAEISRAAFVAALTGPLPYREAKRALETAGLGADVDRLLTDHAYCYPPGASSTVLEPFYPDRLAEDFLALSLPGHHLAGHASDPWAAGIPELLLPAAESVGSGNGNVPDGDGGLPPYAPRALTFLTSASHRWPHVLATLETLDTRLPEEIGASGELAAAASDLAERLAPHRLSVAADPAERARINRVLGKRLDRAGRAEKAAPALAEAVRLYRELAASNPQAFESVFAKSSLELAVALVFADVEFRVREPHELHATDAARLDQAAAAFRDAIETFRRLAAENPAEHQEDLVAALVVAHLLVPRLGPSDLVVATAQEAVNMARHLAHEDRDVSYALAASAVALAGADPEQAEALADEAVGIARRMVREDPEKHMEQLVFMLSTQVSVLLRLERAEEAIDALSEAAELRGRGPQADQDKDPWFEVMAQAVSLVWLQERATGVTTGRSMAVQALSRLAYGDTSDHASALLRVLLTLAGVIDPSARPDDLLAVYRAIIHLLKTSDEIPYVGDDGVVRSDINGVLTYASVLLARNGRWEEALAYLEEAALTVWSEGADPLHAALGSTLTTMTAMLADLDLDWDGDPYHQMARLEAVRVLERIAETYRRLAQDELPVHELGLAVTAKILSEALWHLGRWQEAVDFGRESVRTWRRCAAQDGAAEHREQLAIALHRLADKLTATGQAEEAATIVPDRRDIEAEYAAVQRRIAAARRREAIESIGDFFSIHALRARDRAADLVRRAAWPVRNLHLDASHRARMLAWKARSRASHRARMFAGNALHRARMLPLKARNGAVAQSMRRLWRSRFRSPRR